MKTRATNYPKPGDKIRFLDSVGGGTVNRIDEKRNLVYVLDDDGFELPVVPSQCVVIASDFVVTPASDAHGEAPAPIAAMKKEEPSPVPFRHKKPKVETVEVDLHIQQLLDTTSGMSNTEMLLYQLKTAKDTMEAHRTRKGQKIVFIHGKGAGVLRRELEKMLQRDYPKCDYQDASFREYGFGATMVTIR